MKWFKYYQHEYVLKENENIHGNKLFPVSYSFLVIYWTFVLTLLSGGMLWMLILFIILPYVGIAITFNPLLLFIGIGPIALVLSLKYVLSLDKLPIPPIY